MKDSFVEEIESDEEFDNEWINKGVAPGKVGLYDPQLEKDACGVGFIVSIDGISSHKVSSVFWIDFDRFFEN